MDVNNLSYNAHGTIDCDIDHPVHGWISFTASPDDVDPLGPEIYSRAVAGGFGAIAPYVPPIITLEAAKTSKNLEINTARAAANSRTFPHDGHNFACDALSRSDIDGINGYVALNGDFPAQFPGVWKTVANGYYPLPDIEAWKAFYAAMVATGAANFAHAQALKARLVAATTIEEVEAISW